MNESVAKKVGPPGIALALFGLGSIGVSLLMGLSVVLNSLGVVLALLGGGATAGDFQSFLGSTGWQLVWLTVGCFASFLVTFAGLRLRSARSSWLIYLGALMSMLPCCVNCCCLIGLPLGIWVIVVMQDEQVKAAFSEQF